MGLHHISFAELHVKRKTRKGKMGQNRHMSVSGSITHVTELELQWYQQTWGEISCDSKSRCQLSPIPTVTANRHYQKHFVCTKNQNRKPKQNKTILYSL